MRHEDITPELFDRFWAKADQSAGINGCWPQSGCLDSDGYPVMSVGGKSVRGNRFAFISIFGDPPPHLPYIIHKCPDGAHAWCVNPAHLIPVLQAQHSPHGVQSIKTPD